MLPLLELYSLNTKPKFLTAKRIFLIINYSITQHINEI